MSIFVLLLIIFFAILLLNDARTKNIEQMSNDEYDLQIYKNEQDLKEMRTKNEGVTKEFEKIANNIGKNNDAMNDNERKMDELEKAQNKEEDGGERENKKGEMVKLLK